MGVELLRHGKERPMIRTIPGQRKPGLPSVEKVMGERIGSAVTAGTRLQVVD
jgi:hypothetical protein